MKSTLFPPEKHCRTKVNHPRNSLGKIGRYSPEIVAESILSLLEAKDGKAYNNKDTRSTKITKGHEDY